MQHTFWKITIIAFIGAMTTAGILVLPRAIANSATSTSLLLLFALTPIGLLFYGWDLFRPFGRSGPSWTIPVYVALSTILPLLGMFQPEAGLNVFAAALFASLVPILLAGLGWQLSGSEELRADFEKALLLSLIVNAIVAAMQFSASYLNGVIPFSNEVTTWLVETKRQFNAEYEIWLRTSGTFLIPNDLGLFAALSAVVGLTAIKNKPRAIGVTATSLFLLILSNSRGSALALSGALLLILGRRAGKLREPALRLGAFILMGAIALFAIMVLAAGKDAYSTDTLLQRFSVLPSLFSGNFGADQNFAGRIFNWGIALEFFKEHPLGTLLPPQVYLAVSPDNMYIYNLVQGGIGFAVLTFAMLTMLSLLIFRSKPGSEMMGSLALVMLINGVSAPTFQYLGSLPFWIGLGLYAGLVAKQSARPIFVVPRSPALSGSKLVSKVPISANKIRAVQWTRR
jgi:O-antigen ligase